MNQLAQYPGHMSFYSTIIVWTHTQWSDCSTWTTKVVDKNE